MIIERETMIPLGESIVAPHVIIHVYENNPAILPLSIIKNYIDRIVEIEANDYVVPSRLRGNLIGELFCLYHILFYFRASLLHGLYRINKSKKVRHFFR
jgi:hypothetical protein